MIDQPDPIPGPGEERIRVHAAAVNPTDTMLRAGAAKAWFEGRPGPYVPGMGAAGVVDAVGPDTDTSLRPGDPVIALLQAFGRRGGAYAELVVAPVESAVPMPSGADFPAASTLLMNALTARLALDLVAVPADGTVAVTGAAGAFGGYAVRLAKTEGLRAFADASDADVRLVQELGADEVVSRGDDVADRFRALAPHGVDAVIDGAAQHALVVAAVRDGGGLTVVRGWEGPGDRGVRLHKVFVTDAATDHARLLRLREQADAGELTLRVPDVRPAFVRDVAFEEASRARTCQSARLYCAESPSRRPVSVAWFLWCRSVVRPLCPRSEVVHVDQPVLDGAGDQACLGPRGAADVRVLDAHSVQIRVDRPYGDAETLRDQLLRLRLEPLDEHVLLAQGELGAVGAGVCSQRAGQRGRHVGPLIGCCQRRLDQVLSALALGQIGRGSQVQAAERCLLVVPYGIDDHLPSGVDKSSKAAEGGAALAQLQVQDDDIGRAARRGPGMTCTSMPSFLCFARMEGAAAVRSMGRRHAGRHRIRLCGGGLHRVGEGRCEGGQELDGLGGVPVHGGGADPEPGGELG